MNVRIFKSLFDISGAVNLHTSGMWCVVQYYAPQHNLFELINDNRSLT